MLRFLMPILFAAPSGAGKASGQPGGIIDGIMSMLPLILMLFFVWYFLVIRPQKRQQQEHQQLLDSLKKHDNVRTSAGIFGQVVGIDKDHQQVVLKIDDSNNVRMRVMRSSIVEILNKKSEIPSGAKPK